MVSPRNRGIGGLNHGILTTNIATIFQKILKSDKFNGY